MTALHRVKAYFGMVPADEIDAYDGYGEPRAGRYDDRLEDRADDRHDDRRADRWDAGSRYEAGRARDRYEDRYDDRYEDRYDVEEEERSGRRRFDRYEADAVTAPRPRTPRPRDAEHGDGPDRPRESAERGPRSDHREETDGVDTSRTPRGRSWASNTGPSHTSVRSSPAAVSRSMPSLTPVPGSSRDGAAVRATPPPVEAPVRSTEPAEPVATAAPSEITSLQPQSYNEARVIGERYRDGIPVIMNLTDLDDAAAKRLVDFAAGLAFALRGSIEKVTSRVFLLSPPNVEVSASDRRRLAENGYSTST